MEIVAATDAHAELLATFYAAVWDATSSATDVLAARTLAADQNLAEPGQPPPTFLAIQDGRVLGHVSSLPIRIWDGRTELPAYWIKGLMVLPEYRNGPLGFRVLQEAAAHLERSVVLTVAPASRRLFGALGYADQGAVPNFLRPLAPGRILARLDVDRLGLQGLPSWARRLVGVARNSTLGSLAGSAGGGFVNAVAATIRAPALGYRERGAWPADTAVHLDRLWEQCRSSVGSSVVRNAAYLLQRYGSPSETGEYHWTGVWRGNALAGIAVLRAPRDHGDPRLAGIRVTTVSDILAPPNRAAGLALLGAIERRARTLDADAILATVSAPRLRSLLALQGYLRLPGNVHFFIRDVSSGAPQLGGPLSAWWLTRGDGESDQVF